jgi:CBS domain-containing protein
MNREFDVTTENTKLVALYKEMSEKHVSMMPVVRGDELIGIVTMEQIGRYHMLSAARGAR